MTWILFLPNVYFSAKFCWTRSVAGGVLMFSHMHKKISKQKLLAFPFEQKLLQAIKVKVCNLIVNLKNRFQRNY